MTSTPSSSRSRSSASAITRSRSPRLEPMPMNAFTTEPILAVVATVSGLVRRIAPIALASLACCAPAAAASLPLHAGQPVVPVSSALSLKIPRTLVQLRSRPDGGTQFALRALGGRVISPQLRLWRLPSAAAARLLPSLRRAGIVRSVTPDVPLKPLRITRELNVCSDQYCPQEWWWSVVGADRWTAPGPGVPVTMIDAGTDLSHPDFLGRLDTTPLNTQTFSPAFQEELHGTATASVVAAQVNTVDQRGLVGIYPQAKLQLWDASPGGVLTVGDEIAGLAAARAHGRGVVNLSLGGTDHLAVEEHSILRTVAEGSLVVASAGNDRMFGSPASYPASFAHVLTIGATNEADRPTTFSSTSPHMDLAAPGQDIPVAVPSIWEPSPGNP